MNKIVTYFTIATASFAFALSIWNDITLSIIIAISCVLLTLLGYVLENFIKTSGNEVLNKIIYIFSKNDKDYNILQKTAIYTYLGNDQYEFKKEYQISPQRKDLDRINDRFKWSGDDNGCKITPLRPDHSINNTWQQENWRCYSIYFNQNCQLKHPYIVGSKITNLIDKSKSAVPFLSNSIGKKTKCLTLVVVFPQKHHPKRAKFEVFSSYSELNPNFKEELTYDEDINGFKKTIHYPRKGWKYVISWK